MPELELHPGTRVALARTQANETDIAKMIAAGELTSPQRFGNSHYFDLRLTGTGHAYRAGLKEYVWRDPSLYLNQEFLDRCSGLPVIVDHPAGEMLNTEEYQKRNIGSVVLPYIRGDEVWGVARILDAPAARFMAEHQVSTSPAVVFSRPDTDNEMIEVPGGRHLLIEGSPALVDHVAVCLEGVWDKGGPPTGVDSNLTKEGQMADEKTKEELEREEQERQDRARRDAEEEAKREEEEAARADARRFDEKLDKLLSGIKVLSDRQDALERRNRRDATAEEEAAQAETLRDLAEEEEAEAVEEAKKEAEVAEDSARHRDDRARRDARDRCDAARRKFDSMCDRMRDDGRKRHDSLRRRMDAAWHNLDDSRSDRRDAHRDDDDTMPWEECDRRDGESDDEYCDRMDRLAAKHDAPRMRKRDDESKAAYCDRVARDARRDRAVKADRARMDSVDRIMGVVDSLAARMDRLDARTAPRSSEDENAFAEAQTRADAVYQSHGARAPIPLPGQNLIGYRVMALRGLQKHSGAWKDTDLGLIARTDASAFNNVEAMIYADAQKAADAPYTGTEALLQPIRRRLATGHEVTEWRGRPLWMHTFMQPGRTTTRLRPPH